MSASIANLEAPNPTGFFSRLPSNRVDALRETIRHFERTGG
jgi:hypothetical protein